MPTTGATLASLGWLACAAQLTAITVIAAYITTILLFIFLSLGAPGKIRASASATRTFPQGLKPELILLHLWHD
jgi:hypothetical protein